MNDVCIIIPTHERPGYLARCMKYYAGFACQVVVADSSAQAWGGPVPANIRYCHLPGLRFAPKLAMVLGSVEQDLVALAPDDDFLFPGAVAAGAAVMRDERGLQACVGDVLSYPEQPPFRIIARCASAVGSAAGPDGAANIRRYLGSYHQVLWSLFRRETLALCMDGIAAAGFDNDNFFELSIATLCAGRGGIHYLRDCWILREVSAGDHWGRRHLPVSRSHLGALQADVARFSALVDPALFPGAGALALQAYLDGQEAPAPRLARWRRLLARLGQPNFGRADWQRDARLLPMRAALGW